MNLPFAPFAMHPHFANISTKLYPNKAQNHFQHIGHGNT